MVQKQTGSNATKVVVEVEAKAESAEMVKWNTKPALEMLQELKLTISGKNIWLSRK